MTLLPGPVALFAGGTFAGEGLLERLHDGETAFIPYAIDPSTTVRTEVTERREPRRVVSVVRAEVVLEDTVVSASRYTVDPGAQCPSRIFLRHAHLAGLHRPRAAARERGGRGADLVPVPLTARRQSVVTLEQTRPDRRTALAPRRRHHRPRPYLRGVERRDAPAARGRPRPAQRPRARRARGRGDPRAARRRRRAQRRAARDAPHARGRGRRRPRRAPHAASRSSSRPRWPATRRSRATSPRARPTPRCSARSSSTRCAGLRYDADAPAAPAPAP